MKITLENVEQVIAKLVYENIEGIESGSLTFNCELLGNNIIKLDNCLIYRTNTVGEAFRLFGDFIGGLIEHLRVGI